MENKRLPGAAIWIPATAVVVLIADVLSKQWALAHLQQGNVQSFVPFLIGLTLVTNTGTAFGMWRSQRLVGLLLPPAICLVIIWWIVRRELRGNPFSTLERLGFGMILGGAIGNMLDRLMRGQVTDFMYFPFYPQFPVFNVADALIDIGVIFILWQSFFMQKHQPESPGTANE